VTGAVHATRFTIGFILTSLLAATAAALPQQTTSVEVGGASTVLIGNRFGTTTDAGLTGRFTYNFTPSFSIDSEFGGYFTNANVHAPQYGGRPLLALVGPMAGFRTRHVDLFLKMRTGVLSYPSAFANVPSMNPPLIRKTDAVLDIGLVAEFHTSARTFIRIDAGTLLTRYGDNVIFQETPPSGLGIIEKTVGFIGTPTHFEIGAGYRLGAIRQQTETIPATSHFTVGPQYSLMTLVRSEAQVRDESSVGGFFSWDFNKYVGLDSSILFFPRNMNFADFQQGGRMLQAVGGVRAGVRCGHIGVFVKARPGIQLFTFTEQSLSSSSTEPIIATDSPYTDIALDVGGILEYYAPHRMVIRLDAGRTFVFYRARTIPTFGEEFDAPGFSASAMQASLAIGWRFGSHGADAPKH
jgi:hypothetical protein